MEGTAGVGRSESHSITVDPSIGPISSNPARAPSSSTSKAMKVGRRKVRKIRKEASSSRSVQFGKRQERRTSSSEKRIAEQVVSNLKSLEDGYDDSSSDEEEEDGQTTTTTTTMTTTTTTRGSNMREGQALADRVTSSSSPSSPLHKRGTSEHNGSSSPPGVLRPSSYANRSSDGQQGKSFNALRFTSTPRSTFDLGSVDLAIAPDTLRTAGATTTPCLSSSSSAPSIARAVPDVGRVIPAGHKKGNAAERCALAGADDSESEAQVLASSPQGAALQQQQATGAPPHVVMDPPNAGDDENSADKQMPQNNQRQSSLFKSHPKTPAGVTRVRSATFPDVDLSTNDIFSPNNISQGACLEKFGYAPGEIVNKLSLEHVISEHEDRLIRFLLARDDRKTLENLMFIENNGVTKESIGKFREDLSIHLDKFKNSPVSKGKVGSRLFFDATDENIPPERPDTAIPKEVNPNPVPFKLVIHKVLVKIAMRLRQLGPNSNREKVRKRVFVLSCYFPFCQ